MSCDLCLNKDVCSNPTCGKGKVQGLPLITNLFLGLTEDCNCKCRYCFVHQNPKHMTYEMARNGLEWLSKQSNSPISLVYFGGEPLLRWDIINELTEYGTSTYGKRLSYNMTSNCLLLNEDKLKFMNEHKIGLLLSFDGCKECQDYNRPLKNSTASSFDIISKKIPLILEYKPNTTMRMTLDNTTVQHYYENHKFAVEQGFKSTFSAINSFANWTEEEFTILEQQLIKLADLFIDLWKEGKEVDFNPLIRTFDKVRRVETNINNFRVVNNSAGFGKCGVGANNSLVLSPSGNLYTCQETYSNEDIRNFFYVGDLEKGAMENRRKAVHGSFNPNYVKSNKYNCFECKVNTVCDGGCLVRNYEMNKNLNIMPYAQCRYEQLMYDTCLYINDKLKNDNRFRDRFRIG